MGDRQDPRCAAGGMGGIISQLEGNAQDLCPLREQPPIGEHHQGNGSRLAGQQHAQVGADSGRLSRG